MEIISVLNVADPLQMAPDPSHMLETIMKGCLCLKGKGKHYSTKYTDRDSLLLEKVKGEA